MANVKENIQKWNGVMSKETWKQMRGLYVMEGKKDFSDSDRRRL